MTSTEILIAFVAWIALVMAVIGIAAEVAGVRAQLTRIANALELLVLRR